ncbi:TRAFAC clade GTPase domain-containing protein [Dactylosporangium darangshiense]|uniref:Double-GTPase 2 domain-containing protein n=1 Tax=Dactylosporangium darangshiense TaxID=579108 RepID=A0ABP8DJ52_9ACTN
MGLIRLQVVCPYCDARLLLNDCPIVATNYEVPAGSFSAGKDQPVPRPVSGREPHGVLAGRPVLWRPAPPRPAPQKAAPSLMQELRDIVTGTGVEEDYDRYEREHPVSDYAVYEDLPARACKQCGEPLPDEIGSRRVFTIGVVGTTGAGKTHFIAALIEDGFHRQRLRDWGVEEFVPDENSAERFRASYQSFFTERKALGATNPSAETDVRLRPMIIKARFRGGPPVLLLIHDIAGETLMYQRSRARYAPFLSRASGLIFLIDPLMIEPIRSRLPGEFDIGRHVNQADLVNACLADLRRQQRDPHRVPVAIAMSKSDLIEEALPGVDVGFRRPPSADRRLAEQEMARIDGEVRNLLRWANANDLLAVAAQLGHEVPLSFHAVAPIGYTPREVPGRPDDRVVESIASLRCLDPLIAVLRNLRIAPPEPR